jgi:hypothetical protein
MSDLGFAMIYFGIWGLGFRIWDLGFGMTVLG